MGLLDSFAQLADTVAGVAANLKAMSTRPLQVDVTVSVESSASVDADNREAEAIKRGQRPQTVAAMRRAIGR